MLGGIEQQQVADFGSGVNMAMVIADESSGGAPLIEIEMKVRASTGKNYGGAANPLAKIGTDRKVNCESSITSPSKKPMLPSTGTGRP